jgi:hypothetical protein
VISVLPRPGFPSTSVLDGFNRANGALGGSWVDQTSGFTINSNALVAGSGDSYIEWNGATYGPNQEVFVTLSTIIASGPEHNLMLKTQGTTWIAGHLEVSYDAPTSQVLVYTFTPPGTWTPRATINGVTFAAGDQFGARAWADGSVQVFKNGVRIGSASVAGWPYAALGGRIGLSVAKVPTARFDDFGGGTVTGVLPVEEPVAPPGTLWLSGAFPNPTNGGATFSLALPTADEVSLTVLDIQGREVWSAPVQHYGAGHWSLSWDGRTAPMGVYLARVRVGAQRFLRRIAIVR